MFGGIISPGNLSLPSEFPKLPTASLTQTSSASSLLDVNSPAPPPHSHLNQTGSPPIAIQIKQPPPPHSYSNQTAPPPHSYSIKQAPPPLPVQSE